MAIYQATAFFEQLGYGWTETYFRDSGSETDLAVLADFDRNQLWIKRAACLGVDGNIQAQRVSFSDVMGDSVLNYLELPGNQGFTSEDPSTAMLVRFGNTANTKSKFTYFRGVPDDLIINGGQVAPGNALFNNVFNAFQDALITNLYGWISTAVVTNHPVTNYIADGDNRIVFTVGAPALPAPDVNGKLVLRGKSLGVGGKSVLNRQLVVTDVGNNSCTTVKPIAAFPFAGPGGFLVSRSKVLQVIKNARKQRVVTRKVGKVSYRSAGRAGARPRG